METKSTKSFLARPESYVLGLYLAQGDKGVLNDFFTDQIGPYFGGSGGSPTSAATAGGLIIAVIQILLLLAGSIAVIFLIYGGFRYVASRGNEEANEEAKKTISGAVLGLVIIVLSFVIVRIITQVLLNAPGPGTGIQ